jgi:hypothetical protein
VRASNELEIARAEASYYRDRVALLRAKQYRWGMGSSARLEQLERELHRAERRLSELRRREAGEGRRPLRREAG